MRHLNPWIERLSRSDLVAHRERRLIGQMRRTYASNPFYRSFYDAHGVDIDRIRTYAEFAAEVPFVDKKMMLEDQMERPPFGLRATGERVQVHLTSGTTGMGQEMHTLTDADVQALGTPAMYEYRWAGLEPGDTIIQTLPHSLSMAAPYMYQAAQSYGLLPIYAGSHDADGKIRLLERFRPQALIAVPAYLHRLQTVATSMGVDPRRDLPELRVIFTAAEPFSPEWAASAEDFWGATIHEWYGATQSAGAVMFTCEDGVVRRKESQLARGTLHALDHRVMIEVIDPETGAILDEGTGEIVVTVLHRESFPCIRFRMGDRVTRVADGTCACGRPFTQFESGSISRYDDMMKIRGLNVWPEAVDAVIFAADDVDEYRGTVSVDAASGREDVVIELEFKPGVPAERAQARIAQLAQDLKIRIGLNIRLEPVPPGSLPRYEFKVRRWIDERRVGREVVHYVEKG